MHMYGVYIDNIYIITHIYRHTLHTQDMYIYITHK